MKTSLVALSIWILMPMAYADRLPLPADTPSAYTVECGSCHLAYPPALLSANDWQRVINSLDKHYGDNASLESNTQKQLADFLQKNAGYGRRVAGASTNANTLPKITRSDWFVRKHREVGEVTQQDGKTQSLANCVACHTRAEAGSYSEREIKLPAGMSRWEGSHERRGQ